jgi:hypothetical protein
MAYDVREEHAKCSTFHDAAGTWDNGRGYRRGSKPDGDVVTGRLGVCMMLDPQNNATARGLIYIRAKPLSINISARWLRAGNGIINSGNQVKENITKNFWVST